jgi:hypothetical protein
MDWFQNWKGFSAGVIGAATALSTAVAFARVVQAGGADPRQKYEASDFGTIEVRGACSYTSKSISCWNASGRRDSELTELVNAHYLIDSRKELTYRFGRKNRLLIFSQHKAGEFKLSMPRSASGASLRDLFQLTSRFFEHGTELEVFSFSTKPTDRTAMIEANYPSDLKFGEIALKKGAESQTGTAMVRLESIVPGVEVAPHSGAEGAIKTWTISLNLSGFPRMSMVKTTGRFLDSEESEILRADRFGVPITDSSRSQSENRTDMPAVFFNQQGVPKDQIWTFSTNLDPSKAAMLDFEVFGERSFKLEGIPLDPR